MKKVFLLLLPALFALLAAPAFAQAQLPPTPAYWQSQDSLFQNLDKRKITTGALYDRVFIWANVHLLEAGDTITYSFAQQAWHELYLAAYVPTGLLPVDSLRMRATMNKLRSNVLSVGCINYQFQMIDSNAADDGRLVIGRDSLFYDGSGGSPYNLVAKAFPVVTENEIRDTLTTFYFDSTLQLNNVSGEYATAITLKNSTGDSIRLTPGAQGVLSFGKEALDTNAIILTTTVYFNTGRKVGYGVLLRNNLPKFTVYDPDGRHTCVSEVLHFFSGPNLTFQGYDESIPTQGRGDYKIYYHLQDMTGTGCDKHIRKPIIVLDGFDPKDAERPQPDDIYALLQYPGPVSGLGAELRLPDAGGNPGFDIIVLNFPQYIVPGSGPGTGGYRDGGADYIERNAMVLVKLIQDINDQLAANGSTEKIVVIGPSMGGLISRYALKYMENKNALGVPKMNHNCRLWVSFDSPHLGANIPPGLQSLIWYAGYKLNDEDSKKSFDEKLRSYAARQMLIYQTGGNIWMPLYGNSIFFSEPMRATWQNAINTLGYPGSPRKVALINGTTSGNWETPCKTEIQYFARKHASPFQGMRLVELKASFYPDYGQNCEFFYGYKRGKAALSASINNTDVRGSLDIVPGGLFNTNEIVKDGLDPVLGKFYTKVNILDQRVYADGTLEKYAGPYHTFIPSVSSLGFYNSNFHWANNIGNRNLVCTGEIPFDNYFTAKSNETHVSISEAAAKWITEEIRYGQPA